MSWSKWIDFRFFQAEWITWSAKNSGPHGNQKENCKRSHQNLRNHKWKCPIQRIKYFCQWIKQLKSSKLYLKTLEIFNFRDLKETKLTKLQTFFMFMPRKGFTIWSMNFLLLLTGFLQLRSLLSLKSCQVASKLYAFWYHVMDIFFNFLT